MNNELLDLPTFFQNSKDDIERKIQCIIKDKKILSLLEGGKRLRPILANLVFKSCTQGIESKSKYEKCLEGAVCIELAHSASLVNDDIIDRDMERRGKPPYYVKKGVDKAILDGHKLLAYGFTIALNHGSDMAKLYVDTWDEILDGEIEEVNFNKLDNENSYNNIDKSMLFEEYNKIIEMKTAKLFASSCKAGAIEANAKKSVFPIFEKYGKEVGIAYQLADDLVDLHNGEMLNSVILPILNLVEKEEYDFKNITINKLKKKFNKNSEKIKQLFNDEINKHIELAEFFSNSELIPESQYKDLLNQAPLYVVNQMLKQIKMTVKKQT
jgi:geranylgeranyl pyrophosphate synthase